MNNTQSSSAEASEDKQTKPDPKGKAIASFALGIISVILSLSLWLTIWLPLIMPGYLALPWLWLGKLLYILAPHPFLGIFIGFIPAIILGFVGLILGIKGLKSSKNIFAKVGIILNIIGILLSGLLFTYWLLLLILS
jgi:hypothetical protein